MTTMNLVARAGVSLAGVLLLALAGVPSGTAASEHFSLWRYAPPSGTPAHGDTHRAWQRVQGRSFCQFALYVATPDAADPRDAFSAEWNQLARARGAASAPPVPARSAAPNGWTRLEAERDERSDGVGAYRVRQVTFTGHGRRASAVVTFNDATLCGHGAEAFIASLVPMPPETAVAPVPPPAAATRAALASSSASVAAMIAAASDPGRAPQITDLSWTKTGASYSHWGSNFSLPEMTKLFSGQGYARKTWQFGTDGRYRFRLEVWSMTYQPDQLSGIEEHGRWRIEADRVTVEPEQAVAYVEERDSRRRLRTTPAQTARTVYRGRMHWLAGMQAWYLVLAPVDGKPTAREGDFDRQPGIPDAYLYGPPPRVGGEGRP